MDKVVKQILKIKDDKICPFCNSKVERLVDKVITVYNREHKRQKDIKRPLYHCECCDLLFMTKKQKRSIRGLYGYSPAVFSVKDKCTLTQARKKLYNYPVCYSEFKTSKNQIFRHQDTKCTSKKATRALSSVNLNRLPKVIYKTNYKVTECPACKHKLMNYVNVIPINDVECLPFDGKYCASCNKFFEDNNFNVEKIVANNPAAKDYSVVMDYFIPSYLDFEERFYQIESSVVLAVLSRKVDQSYRYITIVKNKSDVNHEDDILHYSDRLSRSILTAILYGKNDLDFNDEKYVIAKTCFDDESAIKDFSFLLKDIKLKKGGGYAKYNNDEVVDVLLYSPYTQILEIIRASYNKEEDKYYMDIGIFRKFIYEYGNPELPVLFSSSYNNEFRFSFLKEESLLRAYGYSVSQKDNLSDSHRRRLLSEVIDLNLMTPYDIINLLTSNINLHSGERYFYARKKWKQDIEFVSNYRVNPNRFIIAGEINK